MQSSSVLRTAGVVRLLGDLLSGDTDLLVFRRFDSQSVLPDRLIWLENDGAFPPSFVEHEISTSGSKVQIQTGDLDGDGDEGVIVMADSFGPTLARFGGCENLDGDGTKWATRVSLVDESSSLVIDDVDVSHRRSSTLRGARVFEGDRCSVVRRR